MDSSQGAIQTEKRVRNARVSQERRMFRDLFVGRLRRIKEQRQMYGPELTPEARCLIDRALYSTYWDCVRLGLRDEARVVLDLPGD